MSHSTSTSSSMYTRYNEAQDETEEARVPRGTCQCWHTWHVGQRRHVLLMTREFGTRGTWHRTIQAHLAHGTGQYWHQWNGHPYKTLGTSNSRRRRRQNSTTVKPNTGTGCNELSHREVAALFSILFVASVQFRNCKFIAKWLEQQTIESWYLNSLRYTRKSYEKKPEKHHSLSTLQHETWAAG